MTRFKNSSYTRYHSVFLIVHLNLRGDMARVEVVARPFYARNNQILVINKNDSNSNTRRH